MVFVPVALAFAAVLAALLALVPAASAQSTTSAKPSATSPAPITEAMKLAAAGDDEGAVKALGVVLADTTLTSDRRATVLTDRGVLLARLGRIKPAMADFNAAAQLFPENPALYNNRGAALLDLDFAEEALRDFDRALLLAPSYVAALNNRASALLRLKRPADAVETLTAAIKLTPETPPVQILAARASALLAEARPRAAIRDLEVALEPNSRFGEAYRLRAAAYMALGDGAAAAEDLSRALAFVDKGPSIFLQRGAAYLMARDIDAAIRDFTASIELAPADAEGYLERGHARLLTQAFEAAEADLAKGLELAPRSAKAYAYRALMLKKMGQAELGAVEVEKAERLGPGSAVVAWSRGEIEEALGRPDAALRSFRAALQRDPALHMAALGVERINGGPSKARIERDGLGTGDWSVVQAGASFIAINDRIPRLEVPLELAGEGQPRLLGWEAKADTLRSIGVLTYHAGTRTVAGQPKAVEVGVIVDTYARKVVAYVPHRDGEAVSKWTWSETGVEVAAVDGLTTKLELRAARTVNRGPVGPIERRRVGASQSGGPDWAPWNRDGGRRAYDTSRTARSRPAPSKPKTLFDMLLGN